MTNFYPEIPCRLPIRLGQFLKLANLAESGADAAQYIAEGDVAVNGDVCEQRGKQLVAGDVVEVQWPGETVGAVVGSE